MKQTRSKPKQKKNVLRRDRSALSACKKVNLEDLDSNIFELKGMILRMTMVQNKIAIWQGDHAIQREKLAMGKLRELSLQRQSERLIMTMKKQQDFWIRKQWGLQVRYNSWRNQEEERLKGKQGVDTSNSNRVVGTVRQI